MFELLVALLERGIQVRGVGIDYGLSIGRSKEEAHVRATPKKATERIVAGAATPRRKLTRGKPVDELDILRVLQKANGEEHINLNRQSIAIRLKVTYNKLIRRMLTLKKKGLVHLHPLGEFSITERGQAKVRRASN